MQMEMCYFLCSLCNVTVNGFFVSSVTSRFSVICLSGPLLGLDLYIFF